MISAFLCVCLSYPTVIFPFFRNFLSSLCRKDCFKTDAISCPLCGDFSLICLYNCSCHGKADSIAAAFPGPRRIRTVEAVKEAVEITFRQGIAGILHRKFCFLPFFRQKMWIFPPSGVYLTALSTRRETSWWILAASPSIWSSSAISLCSVQRDLFRNRRGFKGRYGIHDGF